MTNNKKNIKLVFHVQNTYICTWFYNLLTYSHDDIELYYLRLLFGAICPIRLYGEDEVQLII